MEQRNGVKVKNRLGLGVVTQCGVVAGEAQNIINAKQSGAEYVGLQCDAVPVAAGKLVNSVESVILKHLAGSQGTKAHDRGLIVGYVNCVNSVL